MVSLNQTSLPRWAHAGGIADVDHAGRSHTLIAIGPRAHAVVEHWAQELSGDHRGDRDAPAAVRPHHCADAVSAVAALEAALAGARVGLRIMVAGGVQDCLVVRAAAVRAGLADDEMAFGIVGGSARTVWCVHCRATTTAAVTIDDTVTCTGCERDLVVYPHVSRRTGHFLGFMVDAETQPWPAPRVAPVVETSDGAEPRSEAVA